MSKGPRRAVTFQVRLAVELIVLHPAVVSTVDAVQPFVSHVLCSACVRPSCYYQRSSISYTSFDFRVSYLVP